MLAKQVGAESSSGSSSGPSVRVVFHVATGVSPGCGHRQLGTYGYSRLGSDPLPRQDGQVRRRRGERSGKEGEIHKDPAKSCNFMRGAGKGPSVRGVMKGTIGPLPAPSLPDVLTLAGTSGQAE